MSRTLVFLALAALLTTGCGRPDRSGGDGSDGRRVVIQNKGSDTLVNVAQAWAEAYREVNPNVAIAVTGGGSGTGISSMINGTVDLANSSRSMKEKELAAAKKNGVNPVEHIVGYDALAVFLHPTNPISQMTLAQLADIYGEHGKAETWSQLGIKIEGCPSDEIVRISRQNNSGTYAYFKKAVLGREQDYKLGSRDMHGSKDVVDLVQHTPCAIGYSGLAYANDGVKMPCVSKADGAPCVAPSPASAVDGSYPVSRPLFMYTAGEPTGATKTYLDWILSPTGQCIISKKGYAPVTALTDCA
jgi:phosphate transport system substrate-binding protein